jgi:predicted ATPase/DNA-binding SARP family transcriptional activator
MLGRLAVISEGEAVEIRGGRMRSLLGVLLVRRNQVVSLDELVDALWAGEPPRSARTVVQGHVSQLRKLLGPVVATEGPGYRLAAADESVDAARFERLVEEERWEEALRLWQGPALADFTFDSWSQVEIGRLEELRLVAREGLAESRLEAGAHREVVPELEALVAEQPLRERPRALLMLALYRSGRQAEALEVYQGGRVLLVEELGIDPGPELQALHRQILNQDASLAGSAAPAAPQTNIPVAATELVGRSRELAELAELLERPDVRLLTLTGPGGTGKTRLAAAAAAARAQSEPDGVWFVDLSALRDPRLVLPEIARTLAGREDLDGVLAGKRLLLVLDNFEQVVDAAVAVARLLLAEAGVRALVTSREPLRVQGEHEFAVLPLPEGDAVDLFAERARAVAPGFEPGPEVAEICRRLDGLPLAIQLAAARTKLLSAAAILERLEHRLPLLTHGPRDLPERQQTLRATIAWSHELLSQEERHAFEALSIFAGGFTVEAAQDVADVDLDLLASLVDRSLVRVREPRFSMLETIREFALEQLDEERGRELRRRHARFYLGVAERGWEEADGADQARWLQEFELEHDNIRAALGWALADDPELALRVAVASGRSWARLAYFAEGSAWLERALVRHDGDPVLRAEALGAAAPLRIWMGDLEGARTVLEEAIAVCRRRQDLEGLVRHLNSLAIARIFAGEADSAVELLAEALELAERVGDRIGVAATTHNLGDAAFVAGDFERAEAYYTDALELSRELGHTFGCAVSLEYLAAVRFESGDVDGGAAVLAETFALARELDDAVVTAQALATAAAIAVARGRPALAARLLGASERLRSAVRVVPPTIRLARVRATEEAVRQALDAETLELETAAGRSLDADAAAGQALTAINTRAPA